MPPVRRREGRFPARGDGKGPCGPCHPIRGGRGTSDSRAAGRCMLQSGPRLRKAVQGPGSGSVPEAGVLFHGGCPACPRWGCGPAGRPDPERPGGGVSGFERGRGGGRRPRHAARPCLGGEGDKHPFLPAPALSDGGRGFSEGYPHLGVFRLRLCLRRADSPELCPVCKVPPWKFDKVEGRG